MKDSTRHHLREWGYEQDEIDALAFLAQTDVEIDLLSLAQVLATNRKVTRLMADVSGLEAAVASLTGVEEAIISKLDALVGEVSTLEAGDISQEKIDSLTSAVTGIATALGSAVTPPAPPAEEEAPPAPPAEEEAPPTPPAE